MRINKTIRGERFRYYIKFIPNTMKAEVRYHLDDLPAIGIISKDYKFIILPDDYLSQYITEIGRIKIGKIKLNRAGQSDAKDYNS